MNLAWFKELDSQVAETMYYASQAQMPKIEQLLEIMGLANQKKAIVEFVALLLEKENFGVSKICQNMDANESY
jgi:endonuclease III